MCGFTCLWGGTIVPCRCATGQEALMTEVINHCAICGKEIEPEEEYCAECGADKDHEVCPKCGKAICECEVGAGD
jgi:predicted amidophosphoribosyltransferase